MERRGPNHRGDCGTVGLASSLDLSLDCLRGERLFAQPGFQEVLGQLAQRRGIALGPRCRV